MAIMLLAAAPAVRALPANVEQALLQANVPADALSAFVQEVGTGAPSRLDHGADVARNPGSLFKLVTTFAALDMLGPAWRWRTPVWLNGKLHDGVLDGSLVIQGSGDPTLVLERVWLLLEQVRARGVREIRGDIVLDRRAFAPGPGTPADFDGEPLRPYNVRADALLLNHKAVTYRFVPDSARGQAKVVVEPALAGVAVQARVPLVEGPCGDWRAALRATLADPLRVRFAGGFPLACGEATWPAAYADPERYDERLLEALWRSGGGALRGRVRDGAAPACMAPTFEWVSPPLADVVRDINKFSNNVMAQQLFLTLALQWQGVGTPDAARALLEEWLVERLGAAGATGAAGIVVDNGSGLSRRTRLSARQLARVLQAAWASPLMFELVASLPVSGLDGTLVRSKASVGRAHLKTGSLRDIAAIAGIVDAVDGRRYVLVAIVEHANAAAARPALDALVQWTIDAR